MDYRYLLYFERDARFDVLELMTVLCFAPDGPIEGYLLRQRMDPGEQDTSPYDDQGRAAVGIIYVSVRNEGGRTGTSSASPSGPPGSTMSVLFWQSYSIRSAMVQLLEDYHGVYGVFDIEDYADLIRLRGERLDDRSRPPSSRCWRSMSWSELRRCSIRHGGVRGPH